MICLYEKTETNFTYNGLGTLEPIECSFLPSINGVWTLKMTLPVDPEGKSNLIENDKIIKVTDIDCIEEQTSDYQLFRIYDFRKEQNYVYVTALPVGLDARFDTFVRSLKLYNKTAAGALSDINNLSNKYTVSGSGYDSTVKSAEFENANIISILNGEESFVTTWDGEICYDNYNLKVNHRLGTNSTPLDVRYGKNIMGMSYDLDASNVITRLYPKAKSGELLNAIADYKIANEQYVDAENASDYPIPHIYYCEAPYNLVQLSDDGSQEYTASHELYEEIKILTAAWLRESLTNDSVYDGLLNEIELDWILNNYAATSTNDGFIGIAEHIARNIWTNEYHNILSETVKTLIYNAIKAGFDEVLKNTESEFYLGVATKSWRNNFYSYTWDVNGEFRVRAEEDEIAWIYATSKWHQIGEDGYATGVTDSTKWKWYKKKVNGVTIKRYGNKKKNRYLHSQWWKINDVWYWFNANGEGKKGAWLNNTYNEYFDEAEIDYSGSDHTIYEMLLPVCIAGEADLFELLYRQMTIYCYYLYETDKLAFPTIKLDINMVDLSRTEEYKDYEFLERIHLGNEVRIYNPRLMPEPSTVRVIGLTYDVLRKCNTEITIGITESSVINLLNSIGQSKETKYVAGDGITIENNVIKVNPPSTPYLEDVIVNGNSVVRNHKAYIDLDEMGIDETIDVLYGEEAPDDELDGEDKDFYIQLKEETADVLEENDYTSTATTSNPIEPQNWTTTSRNEFSFDIYGKPNNRGEGEYINFNLHGLVEGHTYTITFKFQFASGATFPWGEYNDYLDICGTRIDFATDTQEHTYTATFTYEEGGLAQFGFPRIQDNAYFTAHITNLTVTGDFTGEIEDFYNKKDGYWKKYTPHEMIGATSEADGQSGTVPQPTIADKDKFFKGDGTWAEVQGASAVSDLTDVELTDLADKEILEWDAVAEKWKNVANSGGGGGTGGSSVYSEKQLYKASADSFQNISVTWDWEEYDAYIFNAHDTCITTSYKQNGDSTILSKAQIKNLIDTDLTQYFYRGTYQTTYKFSANTITAMNNSGGYFVTEIVGLKFGTLSPIIYSEEEREVGVWIDNKPLYAKSFQKQLTPNSANIDVSDLDIENGWIYDGFYDIGVTNLGLNENLASNLYTYTHLNNELNPPYIDCFCAGFNNSTVYVTILYTKTTDVAGSGSYNTLGMPNFMHGTSAPTANEGAEGCLFLQTDNKFITFDGTATTNKWVEPIHSEVDMTSTQTIYFDFKDGNISYKVTKNISDFRHDPAVSAIYTSCQLSTHVYAYYDDTNPTWLDVSVDTGTNLTVYRIENTMNNNEARIAKIFGKINNKWLEYQPN